MRWATRAGIHVDRTASAWLIRTFVDSDASFVYVTDPGEVPSDATPFDIAGAEISHHEADITFETILRTYDLHDPVLWRMAEIVHEADLEDERYDAPEAPGLELIISALGHDTDDESTRLHTSAIFDRVYAYLRHQMLRD